MKGINRRMLAVLSTVFSAVLLASIAVADGRTQGELEASLQEGWNTWRVPSSSALRQACCYSWNMGTPTARVCKLDENASGVSFMHDKTAQLDEIQVYAHIASGRTSKIRVLSPQCRVEAGSTIKDLGEMAAETSITWLQSLVAKGDGSAEHALAAIAVHPGGVNQLILVVENQRLPMAMRERALFWMAQSNSDDAFDYVSLLLNRKGQDHRRLF